MSRAILNIFQILMELKKGIHYKVRLLLELYHFKSLTKVHDLPDIFHYWSNKYLLPKFQEFGFNNAQEFYFTYMSSVCVKHKDSRLRFISIGSGNCDLEAELVEMLLTKGVSNFIFDCLDLNPHMLARGKSLAKEKGWLPYLEFIKADINSWTPKESYYIIMVNQSLHHFLELEVLFDKIYDALHPDGYFLTDDMIGRNGHMLWPEALEIVNECWKELPEKYKYNHFSRSYEIKFVNRDCSKRSFEGIRAQDILPLLTKKFHFDLFFAFGNVVNPFVDRVFGHNFSVESEWDRQFIDRVHAQDEACIEKGIIKPTHMIAAMTRRPTQHTKIYKHLTPEFCLRKPD